MKMYDPEDTYIDFYRKYENYSIDVHYNKEETDAIVLDKYTKQARKISGRIKVCQE